MRIEDARESETFRFSDGRWWYCPPSGGRHKTTTGVCQRCGAKWVRPIRKKYTYEFCSAECQRASISESRTSAECDQCGATFYRKPSHIDAAAHSFCSYECRDKFATRRRVTIECDNCGEPVIKRPCEVNEGGSNYCSTSCNYEARRGAGTDNFQRYMGWRGPYLYFTPSHPQYPNRPVHNVLWHEANPDGRCESCGGEVQHVHHQDEDPANNALSNLAGLCAPCHASLHHASPNQRGII